MSFIQIKERPDPGPFQWSRKFFHMLGLLIPLFYYLDIFKGFGDYVNPTRSFGFLVLVFLSFVAISVDLLRFKFQSFNSFILKKFGDIVKEEENEHFNAITPYLISCSILVFFFSKEVVAICCILLMIGDPFAAFVGSRYGRLRFWNGKSLEGIFTFIVSGFLASLAFLWIHTNIEPQSFFSILNEDKTINVNLLFIVFCGAFFAAIAEFFSGSAGKGLMDDNLFVPIGGALGLLVFVYLLLPMHYNHFIYENLRLFVQQ